MILFLLLVVVAVQGGQESGGGGVVAAGRTRLLDSPCVSRGGTCQAASDCFRSGGAFRAHERSRCGELLTSSSSFCFLSSSSGFHY